MLRHFYSSSFFSMATPGLSQEEDAFATLSGATDALEHAGASLAEQLARMHLLLYKTYTSAHTSLLEMQNYLS